MRGGILKRPLLFISRAALFMFVAACFCLVFSEVFFYGSNKIFYFLSKSALKASSGMSQYREPFELEKHKGRKRIVTVGGSTTYGFGVDSNDTWPKRLSVLLELKFPGQYEVINLGRVGGHLEEFMRDYERSLNIYISRDAWMFGRRPEEGDLASWGWKDLASDILIVAPVVNDSAPDYLYLSEPNGVSRAAFELNMALSGSFIYDRLAFGYYLKRALMVLEERNRTFVADDSRRVGMIKRSYRANLSGFLRLWGNKPKVIILGFPLLFNSGDGEKEARKAASYWNLADTDSILREVLYLPLLEGLEKQARAEVSMDLKVEHMEAGAGIKKLGFNERLRFYNDPVHMNAKGTRLVAEEVYRSYFSGR